MSRVISETSCVSMHRDFLSIFTACNGDLMFLTLGKSHDFNILVEGFSKTIKFIWPHFHMRNFNCTAAEVTEVNFKTSANVCLPVIRGNIFLPNADDQRFPFSFQKCRNVVFSLEVGLWIISFRHPFGLLLEILVTRGKIVDACLKAAALMHQSRLGEDLEFLSSESRKKPPSLGEMFFFQCPRPREFLTKFRPHNLQGHNKI